VIAFGGTAAGVVAVMAASRDGQMQTSRSTPLRLSMGETRWVVTTSRSSVPLTTVH
jgi:hypothetical protein